MLKTLVIIRMKAMFAGMFARGNKRDKKGGIGVKILFVILAIYVVGCFGSLFGGLFYSICKPFVSIGMGWLFFGFMALMVFLLCFVGSVFVTQSQLYDATDNDLLLSMPVPPKYILASRILALVLLNYVYEFLIVIPGGVVFCILQPVTVLGVVFFILAALLLPLLVITFSAVFGWIIAMANTRMRNKNLITMILSVALFAGYMYLCFTMQDSITKLIANGQAVGDAIKEVLPPFYYFGTAVYDGNIASFGIFLLWVIVPFIVVYKVLDISFIKIATTNRGLKKIKYKEREMKVTSIKQALFFKELRHFLGNSMYMFNAGIGLVFMVIGAIYALVKKNTLLAAINVFGGAEYIGPLICVVFGMMSAMTIISSPTISIDGKTMWITNAAPISEKDILMAKAKLHIYASLPFVIVSEIIVLVGFRLDVISIVGVVVFPIVITMFDAFLGIMFNLKYPKFDWINETAAIKQGASPMLSMLVSATVIIVPSVIYIFALRSLISAEIFTLIFTAILIAGTWAIYKYIVIKGVVVYRNLQN